MAKGGEIRLRGDRALRNLIDQLPKRVERKGQRAAVTAMARPVTKRAKATAPKESGLLKRSITQKIKTYPKTVVAIIGASREVTGEYRGRRRVPANYIHLVEKGTAPHPIGEGNHPGAAGSRFMENAYESTKAAAQQIGERKMAEVINREAAKLGSKGR